MSYVYDLGQGVYYDNPASVIRQADYILRCTGNIHYINPVTVRLSDPVAHPRGRGVTPLRDLFIFIYFLLVRI